MTSHTRVWFCLVVLMLTAVPVRAQSAVRPNVVLIIADDLAWEDSGTYGNPRVGTPNIDRLAREGMKFTAAFVTISSCSPSRSSMITGRYPHSTDAEQLHWPLPPAQVTFVERLKAAGYWTAASGKWHMGDAAKSRFDIVDDPGEAGFQTDPKTGKMLAADDSGAAGWLPLMRQRPRDRPFFLWFAALDPHRDYVENSIARPHRPSEVIVPPHLPDAPEVRHELALYYDEISRLDDNVGKVIAELERQGVADNTLILFISDNGRPFPGAKTTMYDAGIRTPLLARWPKGIRRGLVADGLVSSVDLAPTILQLAGVPIPPTVQGRSFVPMLTDPGARTRTDVFAEKNWHDYEDRVRAVRTGRFKYIRNDYADLAGTPSADAGRSPTMDAIRRLHLDGTLTALQARIFLEPRPAEELYDVNADPQEIDNLAANPRFATTLADLRERLTTWQRETNDSLPACRTPDEFDRKTGQPLPGRQRPRPDKGALRCGTPIVTRGADGLLSASAPLAGTVIRYTLDGSEPTHDAGVWLAPVDAPPGYVLKARAFKPGGSPVGGVVTIDTPLPAGMVRTVSTLVPVTQNRDWRTYDWVDRHAAAAALMRERRPEIVMLGDSITHFWGGEPDDGRRTGVVAWDRLFAGRRVVNLGYGWDRTENVLWRLTHGEFDGVSPEVAVVMIGTNNVGRNTPDEIAGGIQAICALIHDRSPSTRILLLAIFPRGERPNPARDAVSAINQRIAALDGRDGITYLDIGSVFVSADGTIGKDVMDDFLHPTAQGYTRWAAAMAPTLERLLAQSPTAARD